MTPRKITRELPVQLSKHEMQLFGGYIAEKHKDKKRLSEEKKRVGAEYKAKILKLEEDIDRLSEAVNKGEEIRQVTCEERWHAGMIEVVRVDTQTVVDTYPGSLADAQIDLPIDGSTDLRELGDAANEPAKAPPLPPRAPARVGGLHVVAPEAERIARERAAPSEDDELEAAAADALGEGGELVESSVGDRVFVADQDAEPEDGADGNPGDPELDQDELDDAYEQRQKTEQELADERAAGEAYDAAVPAPKSKRNGKGGRKKKAR